MTEAEWVRECSDSICKFCGEDARKQAERAAQRYLDMQSVDDDPVAASILILEGWSMSR